MSNQKAMIELIKAMSGQANVLSIPRPYIEFMGSLDGGLFLSQLIYWSDRGKQKDGWFYKTYDEWETELTLSKYEVSKQVNILKDMGILETKVKKANGAPTVHYKFSFDEFQKSFVKFLDNRKLRNLTIESEETLQSITETTTETTTEISAKPKNSRTKNSQALNDLADSIASVCGNLDIDMIAPKTRDALKVWTVTLHKKGATPSVVMDGFGPWWYDNTWQGKKGQPPTLQQLGDHWGQFEAANTNGASSYTPNLTPEQIEMLRQFQLDTSPIK